MTKYRAKKVTVDGITFDSKKEAKRYVELLKMQAKGYIEELELQKKYVLIPAQYEVREQYSKKTGKRIKDKTVCIEKECAYFADFRYYSRIDQEYVVEDTKGFRTAEYIIKRKLMLYMHGIKIHEI